MCRKTLEGICKAHGSQARQLVDALKELKDNGTIESRLFDWADLLRIAGNEAAHDVDIQIAAEDAHDLVEFTGALLDYVFSFRERFEKFKNRKSERDAAKLGPVTKGG
jgi:hypothetical protein